MSNDNEKISMRQAMLFIIVVFCAPAIRYIPLYTVNQAGQAAWLSPLITLILELVYILVWWGFFKKYERKSFVEIIKDIMGKIFGNIVCIMYFLWITLMLVFYLRMYGERVVSTSMSSINIIIILVIMFITVWYVLRSGIVPLAKMNEIIFLGLGGIFILYNILVLPELKMENLFPITYKDVVPIFKANLGIMAMFSLNIIVLMFNDKIDHKGENKKLSIKTLATIMLISLLVISVPLCVFGAPILVKLSIPYLNAMMQISLFDIIERVESGIMMAWILADFVLFCVLIYSAMHMIKKSFNLSNVKPLIPIYMLGVFFLSFYLTKSSLEAQTLSKTILTYAALLMGYILPIFIFCIGKIRKKV